jgi:hypothetical protein
MKREKGELAEPFGAEVRRKVVPVICYPTDSLAPPFSRRTALPDKTG